MLTVPILELSYHGIPGNGLAPPIMITSFYVAEISEYDYRWGVSRMAAV